MLVLSRKVGQGISIAGGLIRVSVQEMRGRGERAYIGITAPELLRVHRDEVLSGMLRDGESKSKCAYGPGSVTPVLTERADTLAFRFADAEAAHAALKSGVIVFEGIDV